jgi:anti-sigma factor ChrR (cupin superfamily)
MTLIENYNMNLQESVVISTGEGQWLPSPKNGVERIPLEREKKESGHTTSLVRYAPGTEFSPHTHPNGEEIYVLEGVFSDDEGDYPAGTYLRNPPGSSHRPFSKEGCTIFVKLNQFAPGDQAVVRVDTREGLWRPGHGILEVYPLHQFGQRGTALVKWPAGERFVKHTHFGGEEIFVISGVFKDEHGQYPKGSWLRSPHMSVHHPWVDEETIILVKTGHLI